MNYAFQSSLNYLKNLADNQGGFLLLDTIVYHLNIVHQITLINKYYLLKTTL